MMIRRIVLIGIRNLAIITSRCNPFSRFSASIPKKESTILTLRCKPIITSVTSYSFAVWIMPEAIFKSYRVIWRNGTSAEAVIMAAFSKYLLPRSSKPSEVLLSLITFKANRLSFCLVSRINKDRFIRYSIVSGFATGIRILSASTVRSSSRCASHMAILRAALSVIKELTTHVTRISNTVPFSTSSFNKRSPFGKMIL